MHDVASLSDVEHVQLLAELVTHLGYHGGCGGWFIGG